MEMDIGGWWWQKERLQNEEKLMLLISVGLLVPSASEINKDSESSSSLVLVPLVPYARDNDNEELISSLALVLLVPSVSEINEEELNVRLFLVGIGVVGEEKSMRRGRT